METDEQNDLQASPARLRVWHVVVWAVSFALFGGLMWSTATFQCMCGHTAMDAPLGWSVFGSFTLGGLLVGRHLAQSAFGSTSRAVAAAVALMFVGTIAAHVVAGNDLGAAHDNMFEPAKPAASGNVYF